MENDSTIKNTEKIQTTHLNQYEDSNNPKFARGLSALISKHPTPSIPDYGTIAHFEINFDL
jgi:hypothetical protein